MALSKEKTSMMPKLHASLLAEIDALNKQIATHQKAFEEIVKSIAVAETEKVRAKQSYTEQLDSGDSEKMQEALDEIKQSNERIKSLVAEITAYRAKVEPLRKIYADLTNQSRILVEQAKSLLKESLRRVASAEVTANSCLASAGSINNLELAISTARQKRP